MMRRGLLMNIHTPDLDRQFTREDAADALERLRHWAARASEAEIADLDPALARLLPGTDASSYPVLSRAYPYGFEVDAAYKDSLPDLQNGPSSLIRGAQPADPACGHFQFPPADPLSHPRQRRSDAGNQRDRHCQPRGGQEGHQHVPDHAVFLQALGKDLQLRGDRGRAGGLHDRSGQLRCPHPDALLLSGQDHVAALGP